MESINHKTPKLNVAGKIAETFMQSKITFLIIISSILLGLLALAFTPRTYNPEIIVPTVNISVSRPGSNPQEMTLQVVKPLEALMSAIPGVDHTYGMAMDGNAMVTVRFKVNENEEKSLVKVYNQINSNLDRIPPGTQLPLIQSVSLYDVPLVTITLSSADYKFVELRQLGAQVLEELRGIPQIGKSWIAGVSETSLRVWLNPKKLAYYHLAVQSIKQSLASSNVSLSAGKLDTADKVIPLKVSAHLINPDDISNTMVGIWNGKPVYLDDVATIDWAPANDNVRSYSAYGPANNANAAVGKLTPSVTIALARQKGSNGVDVANDILQRLEIIKKHSLPKNVDVTVTRNYGEDANDAVNTLIEHLGIAILAVVAVMIIFLGWREASIVTLSIPLILFLVLGTGWIAGQTINRITLFALILSLGLLVDDSIVVIENIHRHMLNKRISNFGELIVHAANEIGKPTIIATFTVILALLPMAFVGGMMGPFMGPIPFNAPVAMFVSLIIAYTVVPYLAYKWLRKKAQSLPQSSHDTLLHRLYSRLFTSLVESKWWRRGLYTAVGLLLALVMLQPLWQFIRPSGANGPLSWLGVELKMLPDDNVSTVLLEVSSDHGTELARTKAITSDIAKVLADNVYVRNYQIYLGEAAPVDFAAMARGDAQQQGSHYAQIRVNLINKHDRSIGSHEISQRLYASLASIREKYPNTRIKLFETPPGPPVRSQMEGALYGPDYSVLRDAAEMITKDIYSKVYGMINIDNSVTANLPEYQINIDRNKAMQAGFAPESIADEISSYFAGITVGSIHTPNARDPEKIILRLPKIIRSNKDSLLKLSLVNKQNQLVPLDRVGDIKLETQAKPILTYDQNQVVYVMGEMITSSPVYGVTTLTGMLDGLQVGDQKKLMVDNLGFNAMPPEPITQYQFFWEGEMRLTLDVFRDLGTAFIGALVLIYLLLTGYYRSFLIPVIVMGAIPLTIIGVFPGHWLMNQPFTATSMIGVIALAGIVVRNSLLLIDFIIEREEQGQSAATAVMEAGVTRLQPILLTALSIILGSAVMLSDPVFGGLAISLIFGSFASTTLTLFVIPLVYYSWKAFKNHH